jgi:sugar lactone lactonase YvrE
VQIQHLGQADSIEVSPDGVWLYVSASYLRVDVTIQETSIKRYPIYQETGYVAGSLEVVVDFGALDGTGLVGVSAMRADTAGNLYVARFGNGQVDKLSSGGQLLARIYTFFNWPTSLEFGGNDGKTLFITGRRTQQSGVNNFGYLDRIGVSDPGRAWSELQ